VSAGGQIGSARCCWGLLVSIVSFTDIPTSFDKLLCVVSTYSIVTGLGHFFYGSFCFFVYV